MIPSQFLIPAMLAVFYPIFMRLLVEAAQPYRLRLAQLGHELINDPRLEPRFRPIVKNMLEDAFDFRVYVVIGCALPIFVIGRLLGLIPDEDCKPAEVGEKYEKVSELHLISVAVANLLACLATFILGSVFCAVFSIFKHRLQLFDVLVVSMRAYVASQFVLTESTHQ